jgi:predicted Zn finger-like uncharacterized protein
MIIQCPACSTSFSVSSEKFGEKNRKVKCSRCYFIWTANSSGKAIEIPRLYEPIHSQGDLNKEILNKNKAPDHPLPVPVSENKSEGSSVYSLISLFIILSCLAGVWYNRLLLLDVFPFIKPVLKIVDPSLDIRGIDIYNLNTKSTVIGDKPALQVSGSLINQTPYKRIVPNIVIKMVGNNDSVLRQEIINFNDRYFLRNERYEFSYTFVNYPDQSNKIQVEILP